MGKKVLIFNLLFILFSCNNYTENNASERRHVSTNKFVICSDDSLISGMKPNIIMNFGYNLKHLHLIGIFGKSPEYFMTHKDFKKIEVKYPDNMDYDFYYVIHCSCPKKKVNDTLSLRIFNFKIPNHQISIKVLSNEINFNWPAGALGKQICYCVDGKQVIHHTNYYDYNSTYDFDYCDFDASGANVDVYISYDNKFLIFVPHDGQQPRTPLKIIDMERLAMVSIPF